MSKSYVLEGRTIAHFMLTFKESVIRYQDKIAIEGMGESYTYDQLDRISDEIGQHLLAHGVKPGSIVLIRMERHVDVLLGILGAWKARAAFSYIDDRSPRAQKTILTEDSEYAFMLDAGKIAELKSRVLHGHVPPKCPVGELEDLAWLLMTSGTSGRPKRILVTQRNIASALYATRCIGLSERDRHSMIASFSFMSAIIEIFPVLSAGGTIVMVPSSTRNDLESLVRFLEEQKITCCFMPAHFAEHFVQSNRQPSYLRILLTGGEPVHWLEKRGYRIICGYGASETCGPVTLMEIDYQAAEYPIGKLLPNVQMHLLDENLQMVTKPGEIGELCFSGPTICEGYYQEPELTAEHFIPNPFSNDPCHKVLFRTSDLARFDEKGDCYFAGRSDLLCKIRSFRIEIGEVENAILHFPGIERCVVLPMYDSQGTKNLHAFYYSADEIDEASLVIYLRENLLHYKVPTYYHRLENIPLTDNGKVDRSKIGDIPGFTRLSPRRAKNKEN
ncbi:MAG: amino acid adenylation domain-containing protein [Coriobacteriales bacterium]|jgi:bacitracin synthase 1